MSEHTHQFTSANGVPFTARLVQKGDGYGRWDKGEGKWALTQDSSKPVIEFYDGRYQHSPHGQFVSRYFVETLLESDSVRKNAGLVLDTATPDWTLQAVEVRASLAALVAHVGQGVTEDRGAVARERAHQITAGFEYRQVGEATGASTVEVWRCSEPHDSEHAHDLVITRMGITAFGDMDPLVFRVGADYGMKFLAGKDVGYYIHSKLDSSCKETELHVGKAHEQIAHLVCNYLDRIWHGPVAPGVPDGALGESIEALRRANPHNARFLMSVLASEMDATAIDFPEHYPEHQPKAVALVLHALADDLASLRDGQNGFLLQEVIDAVDSDLRDFLSNFSAEDAQTPSMSLMTRLHIVNIGAQRIMEQVEKESQGQSQVFRERAGG